MRKSLEAAFEQIASGRAQLDAIIKEPGFHSDAWKHAFVNAFDQFESLKQASEQDIAELGHLYCRHISTLIDEVLEQPDNKLSLNTLCMIWSFAGTGIRRAKDRFELTQQELADGDDSITDSTQLKSFDDDSGY
jgi:hypothetical protein